MTELLLQTTIRTAHLKRSLIRGSIIAGMGIFVIFATYLTLPPEKLEIVGIWAYLLGCSAIAFGLIPYKRLRQLELYPARLIASQEKLLLTANGKHVLTLPWENIASFSFMDTPQRYGLQFILKEHMKVNSRFAYMSSEKEMFLPYFSKNSFERLKEFYDFEKASEVDGD